MVTLIVKIATSGKELTKKLQISVEKSSSQGNLATRELTYRGYIIDATEHQTPKPQNLSKLQSF